MAVSARRVPGASSPAASSPAVSSPAAISPVAASPATRSAADDNPSVATSTGSGGEDNRAAVRVNVRVGPVVVLDWVAPSSNSSVRSSCGMAGAASVDAAGAWLGVPSVLPEVAGRSSGTAGCAPGASSAGTSAAGKSLVASSVPGRSRNSGSSPTGAVSASGIDVVVAGSEGLGRGSACSRSGSDSSRGVGLANSSWRAGGAASITAAGAGSSSPESSSPGSATRGPGAVSVAGRPRATREGAASGSSADSIPPSKVSEFDASGSSISGTSRSAVAGGAFTERETECERLATGGVSTAVAPRCRAVSSSCRNSRTNSTDWSPAPREVVFRANRSGRFERFETISSSRRSIPSSPSPRAETVRRGRSSAERGRVATCAGASGSSWIPCSVNFGPSETEAFDDGPGLAWATDVGAALTSSSARFACPRPITQMPAPITTQMATIRAQKA